ncbi:MAG: Cys-tRNA(Pro) deacylase [Synergistaceae bacterium]|jgi:Cys-tRNA(Pro)/Cys-tRNA(Cys) deacylase|nr:Cys-tRNA(Pro) deacylase [Synergistaceae bacterium]
MKQTGEAKSRTNAMRILDCQKILYRVHSYDASAGKIDGIAIAEKIGCPPETVCKTLVSQGADREYYVFVLPVARKLDMKLAASAAGVKSVEMIPVADINRVTGYVRGGCSPIGMKKQYATIIDASCSALESIVVSAGRVGFHVELSPSDLARVTNARTAPVATEENR